MKAKPIVLKVILPVSVVLLAVLTFATYVYIYPWARSEYLKKDINAQDILSKAASKNSSALKLSENAVSTASGAAGDAAASYMSIYQPDGNNYHKTKVVYEAGNALTECRAMYSPYEGLDSYSTEYSNYYNNENEKYTSYGDSKTFDSEGNIIESFLSKGNVTIYYAGGKYAVREIYEASDQPVTIYNEVSTKSSSSEGAADYGVSASSGSSTSTMPAGPSVEEPQPPLTDPQPSDIWGQDAVVERVERIDGKDYYVISVKSDIYCDSNIAAMTTKSSVSSVDISQNTKKGARRMWIEKDTYNMIREETYLGDMKDANLIMKVSYENTSEDIDLATANKRFEFGQNVRIKEINIPSYSQEETKQLFLDYVKNNNFTQLVPSGSGWEVNSIYMDKATMPVLEDYRADREYYSSGKIGDSMYKQYTEMQNESSKYPVAESYISATNNTNGGAYLSIVTYSGYTVDQIINAKGWGEDYSKTISKINILLDGQPKEISVYAFDGYGLVTRSYVIELGGYTYVMDRSDSSASQQLPENFEMKTLNGSVSSDYLEIANIIDRMYVGSGSIPEAGIAY